MSYANSSGPKQYQPSGGKDSGGVSATYDYTGTGNPASTSNQSGTEKASLEYNSDGTVSTAHSPNSDSNKTRYTYTNGQLTKITPKTGSTLGLQDLTYDAYGRTKTATNGRGITATYSYDKLDRLTGTSFSDGMTVSYGYDAAGRNSTRTDPNGTTTYGYDQLGRMTSRKNSFDGQTFTYGYNKAGWLTKSTSPTGGTVTYAYDDAGKMKSMGYKVLNQTKQAIFKTDDHGRRTETWLGSNADHTTWVAHTKYSYDKNDQITRVFAEQGSGNAQNTNVVDIDYCYRVDVDPGDDCSGDGPSTTKLQWQENNLTDTVLRYTYKDNGKLNRVYESKSGADPVLYDYAYDGNGNRFEADKDGNSTTDLSFNPENQITTSGYGYDGAGNLTSNPKLSAITYTGADQLKSVTKAGTTYNYKHAGADNNELLSQQTPDGTYKFSYGRPAQTGVPTIETASKDGQTANVISDPVTGQPLLLRTSSGMQSMYVYDGTPGSPIALITSNAYQAFAYEYDPYGLPTLTANSGGNGVPQNPYLFAGGIQDRVTDWVHYGNRYYEPTTGTWTQRDTLDNPLSPLDANRYAYAGGDPINNIDPIGQNTWWGCAIGMTGYVIGLVALGAAAVGTGGTMGLAVAGYVTASAGFVSSCYEYMG